MIIKELAENQIVSLNNEDLTINCDVPNGVKIYVIDGNITINGSTKGAVKISTLRKPRIHFEKGLSVFIADYAIKSKDGITFGPSYRTTNFKLIGDKFFLEVLSIGSRGPYSKYHEVNIPFVDKIPDLKGIVTVTGHISENTEIRASGTVTVNNQQMRVLPLLEDWRYNTDNEVNHSFFLKELLSDKYPYENLYLLRQLIKQGLHKSYIFGHPIADARKYMKVNSLRILIEEGGFSETQNISELSFSPVPFERGLSKFPLIQYQSTYSTDNKLTAEAIQCVNELLGMKFIQACVTTHGNSDIWKEHIAATGESSIQLKVLLTNPKEKSWFAKKLKRIEGFFDFVEQGSMFKLRIQRLDKMLTFLKEQPFCTVRHPVVAAGGSSLSAKH